MSIIEQIKAEVERRRNNARDWSNKAKYKGPHYHKMRGIESACDAILSFLSTLESEKPMEQEGLEREIERCLWQLSDDPSNEELRMFARHFYELGCRCTAEKYDELEYNRQRASGSSEIPKDLEEAVEEYAKEHSFHPCDYDVTPYDCFKAGAKWNKEQMMKEAVEVVVWDAGVDFAPHPVISVEDFNVKDGDKVRIIIVKEDKK